MNNDLKIYTKTGDKGETSLIGGTRVPKDHIRVEAYGTVDELNSFIGVLKESLADEHMRFILNVVQNKLFTVESRLAADPDTPPKPLPVIMEEDITLLEQEIDAMNEVLPPLNAFILPSGNLPSSQCHVARTVCRRAERSIIRLSRESRVEDLLIKYINRLSDYLFVLARKILFDDGTPEVVWKETDRK